MQAYRDLLLRYDNGSVLPPDADTSVTRARDRFERILYKDARCFVSQRP